MDKKLNIIQPNSTEEGIISIVNNEDYLNLMYKTKSGQVNITEGNNNRFRPIHCSELEEKLKSRDWNITERKYISRASDDSFTDKDFIVRSKISNGTEIIDRINTSVTSTGFPVVDKKIDDEIIAEFKETYKDILNSMDANEIYLFNSSSSTYDLLTGSVVIDVIKYNSDTYTNMVNINDLASKAVHSSISCKVDLNIQYTKKYKVYNHSTSFEGFNYKANKFSRNNFIEEIGSDVSIEYLEGIVRVIPVSDDILECIISSCTVTYGNLG